MEPWNGENRRQPIAETHMTLKVGVIASFVAALVMFMLTALWGHQTDISILKTNQLMVLKTIDILQTVPGDLAYLKTMMIDNKEEHIVLMKKLEKRDK